MRHVGAFWKTTLTAFVLIVACHAWCCTELPNFAAAS
jgi:hypothetical protein